MAGHHLERPGRLSLWSRLRGLPARSMPDRSWAHDARAEIGGVWLMRLVPGTCSVYMGRDSCDEIRVPAPGRRHEPVGDTPGRIRGNRCSRRYGWSWPEPPAGATPHHGRGRRALGGTGACGQLGSRTANRMAVPLSPSIRERACPARLRPARTTTSTRRGERRNHGCVLRDRLGRGSPRHRPGRPGREAACPPPDRRRRGRPGPAAGTARRARRQRRGSDPGGDRDTPRAACRLPARHGAEDLPHQPDGGGPLPGPALGREKEVRPRRLGRPGQRAAHRHRHAPAAAR